MDIGDKLRHSGKGRLSYDRETSGHNLKVLLASCSSPPNIHVSPKFTLNLSQAEEEKSKQDAVEKQDNEKSVTPNGGKNVTPKSGRSGENKLSQKKTDASPTSWLWEAESTESVQGIVTSPEFMKSRLAIHKYEEELENQTRRLRIQKQREFEESKLQIERHAELKVQEVEQKANFESLMKIQSIELKHESQAAEIVKQHKMLRETHEQRKQIHDAQIQEAEHVKRQIKQEEIRRKEKERQDRLEKLAKSAHDLNQLNGKIQDEYNSCIYQKYVTDAAKKSMALMQTLVNNMATMKSECEKSGEVLSQHFDQCRGILEKATNAYELVKKELELAEVAAKEVEVETEKQAKLKQQQQEQPQASTQVHAASSGTSQASSASGSGMKNPLCWDDAAFTQYADLQNRLKSIEQSTTVLASTPELKKYKFDIQKAVNTPINAISDVSGNHLRDKLKRLLDVVQGDKVDVGGRAVTVKSHEQLPGFCKNLVARMIVKKGDEQVSSKFESAFAIAMVAVGLWREQPEIGNLLMAHFHAQCPYIVPYYAPRLQGQTDEEYFRSRGYKYEDGEVEKQDKFLKRMSGLMRLYFSIIISSPPRGDHPHGLEYAWTWMTRVLNLEPEPDITAAMIYDFLQVTGSVLMEKYKHQFKKILVNICTEFIPKLKDVSSPAGSGSLSRLQLLLEKSLKVNGHIPMPEGYLEPRFWFS